MPIDHLAHSVDRQEGDPHSVLNRTIQFLHWRQAQPALLTGDLEFLEAEAPLLAMVREVDEQRLLCLFNLGAEPAAFEAATSVKMMTGSGFATNVDGVNITLPGYGAFFRRLLG